MIQCNQCGRENDDSFSFCLDCGAELRPGERGSASAPQAPSAPGAAQEAISCPQCGASLATGSVFCSSCGHRLGEEAPKGRTMFMHQAAPDADQKLTARLVLIKPDGSEGTVFTLAAERTVVGRTQGIIMFPEDPYVSPRHAEMEFKEGKLAVIDLNSLNGVYHRMTDETQIYPGTSFRIGRQMLRLETPGDLKSLELQVPEGDDSRFWGSPIPQVWARLVQVLDGGKIGEIHLLTQPEVLIGREDGEIRFPEDGFISSRHCMLINKGGDCYLRDLGSSNGTYLRIRERQELAKEDRIQIGNQVLMVDLS